MFVPLNPQSAAINDAIVAARLDAPLPTPETMREGYAALIAATGTNERTCKVEQIDVAGLPSLLLTPPSCDDGLLVWFHHGGFVINSPELSLNETDRLAVAARSRCVNVGYRLAPEHKLPAAQLDAIDAARWCLANAHQLGVDPAKVAVGGDSAGGNLAAVCAQRVPGLCAQLLAYAALDLREERIATYPYQEGYLLDRATLEYFAEQSTGTIDLADPLVSPLLADRDALASTPPALVITAEFDPLVNDGREYVAALRAAGVTVEHRHFDDEMHIFMSMPELLDGARVALEQAGAFLARQFNRP
jgi:acetyl esterase